MDVLHYGSDAEIVEPPALREQARALLRWRCHTTMTLRRALMAGADAPKIRSAARRSRWCSAPAARAGWRRSA